MKKTVIYILAMISIASIVIFNDNFDYKASITVRKNEQEKQKEYEKNENIVIEEIKADAKEFDISIPQGQVFTINIKDCAIIFKTQQSDSVKIRNNISENYITSKETKHGILVENLESIKDKNKIPTIEIIIPENTNFDIDIKSNDSVIDMNAKVLKNIKVDSGVNRININAKLVKGIFVEGGKADINISVDKINGDINGSTGIGNINLEIGNIDDININGFKLMDNIIAKITQSNDNKFDTYINGDLGKVLFK